MLSITFKNVDQGDSIIFDWIDNGERHIGIVDCNLKDDYSNPIVEHLKILNVKKIDFFILSHPHSDHYSGILELFEYLDSCNTVLNSCASISDFLKAPQKKGLNDVQKTELTKIYYTFKTLRENGKIKKYITFSSIDQYEECFFDNLKFKFLSPSIKEIDIFNKVEHKETEGRNANFNYVSTFKIVTYKDNLILLTSDLNNSSFKRIKKEFSALFEKEIKLIQVAHHGANSSYYKPFWELTYKTNIAAVVSVGKNIYNHPSKNVIDSINNLGYKIFATNIVGCLNGLKSNLAQKNSDFFDNFDSFPLEIDTDTANLQGDQTFLFK